MEEISFHCKITDCSLIAQVLLSPFQTEAHFSDRSTFLRQKHIRTKVQEQICPYVLMSKNIKAQNYVPYVLMSIKCEACIYGICV